MNTVLSLIILIRLNSLKKDNNYIIADYIIRHINEIVDMSINELAKQCFVSTTSILKFCKLLGFDTYTEFKNTFVLTLKTRNLQLKEKNQHLTKEELLEHIHSYSKDKNDIEEFKTELDHIIQAIQQYKSIYFYGATFPMSLTTSFTEDMALKGYYVNTFINNYAIEQIKEKEGVHIVITLSGRYIETNRHNYIQITSMKYPSVLMTRKLENKGNVDYCLQLPQTTSSQYDEIILLLILDYILLSI